MISAEASPLRHKVESILYSWYPKYDRLRQLVSGIESNRKDISIYVDVKTMLDLLFKNDCYCSTQYGIVAAIVNLAAHMRGFFKNRYGVRSTIYLVYADEANGSHTQYLPNFGRYDFEKTYDYKSMCGIINDRLSMTKMLVDFIPNVYFIHSHTSFAVWSYYTIATSFQQDPEGVHLILSTSKYNYQLTAIMYPRQVYLLRPIKSKDGDESTLITPSTAVMMYYNKLTPNSPTRELLKHFNPHLMSLLMTFNGCSDKKVTAVTNISRAAQIISSGIKENRIINDYQSDMDYVYQALMPFNIHTIIDQANFNNRFRGIDVVFQARLYAASLESKDLSWRKDLHDPQSLMDINDTQFKDSPLDLMNL